MIEAEDFPQMGAWTVEYRVDTYKIEALKAAVEFRKEGMNTSEEVIRTAKIFEAYLKEK